MPPWNNFQIFEPFPLPQLSDPDTRDEIAPEDTPVKNRYRPEYSPRGICSGRLDDKPIAFGRCAL